MLTNKLKFSKFATAVAVSLSLFSISPASYAANVDTSQCESLDGKALGLCRAALKSGCGVDGRRVDSRHCSKLASNYRRLTGEDPAWLEPVVSEPVSVVWD